MILVNSKQKEYERSDPILPSELEMENVSERTSQLPKRDDLLEMWRDDQMICKRCLNEIGEDPECSEFVCSDCIIALLTQRDEEIDALKLKVKLLGDQVYFLIYDLGKTLLDREKTVLELLEE